MTSKRNAILLIILTFSAIAYGIGSDSGKVKPPENLIIHYPSQHVTSIPISDQQHYLLPVCPQIPDCPDINSRSYSNEPNCPTQCTVTRVVDPPYCPGIPAYCPGAKPQFNRVTSVIQNAVCPEGYAQVGSFNDQELIVYNNNQPIRPVKTNELEEYRNHGYICDPQGKEIEDNACINKDAPNPFQPVDVQKDRNGIAVMYSRGVAGNCYWAHENCQGRGAVCTDPFVNMKRYVGLYKEYECRPPGKNLYYDPTTKTPASVVCAHVRPVWKRIETPQEWLYRNHSDHIKTENH